MYIYRFDVERALFVGRMASGGEELADFDAHLDQILAACTDTASSATPLAAITILDRKHVLPNPAIRRRAADVTGRDVFRPNLAIVSGNPLLRGVLTALSWLRTKHYEDKMVSTVEEALAWHEQLRGQPLPELRGMVAEVMARP